ncbi:MAG: hypothetical protein MR393_05800 [Intestinimonas massiliensis]|uniref:hypothetical protein n=1 Tax=Intestinimonas massiliensis (ex Afouda et al. 2020) TaxID=1673721 RepID=UPI00242B4FBA|nr:hypothetical protein [Intestinimonas massiliensis (ex Afouda et al. 2020)]MCI5562636.1 hypothetical protein [Intestinimonas massiliensis (ex Afouda et al. 2020)]
MALITCGKCRKQYDSDPKFFENASEVCCPFCGSKLVGGSSKEDRSIKFDPLLIIPFLFAAIGLIYIFLKVPSLGFIFLLMIGIAIFLIVIARPKNEAEAQAMREYRQKQEIEKEAIKYNNYKYTCPMCGSKKIKNISTVSKVVSMEVLGLASSKIGKSYECEECKYKW